MAEEKVDLDDFFAKRDKKKKSGKNKKFETTEELAKILGKKAEERKKLEEGKSQYVSEDSTNQPAPNEDDEWLDHEEKAPDLTGLKIQELILDDEEDIEVQEGKEADNVTKDGPWRKRAAAAAQAAQAPQVVESEPQSSDPATVATPTASVADDETKSACSTEGDAEAEATLSSADAPVPAPAAPTTGKYVPAHLRRAQEAASTGNASLSTPSKLSDSPAPAGDGQVKGAYVPPGRRAGSSSLGSSGTPKPRKTAAAPNINDEEYFPSLGAS